MASASNITEVVKLVQDSFKELLEGHISEYELSIVDRSIRNPMSRTFTSAMAMTEKIQDILGNLSELNYLKSKLIKRRYELAVKFRSEYDRQFTILTRMGRPSKQSIESEIYSNNPSLNDYRNKLEEFDSMIEYLQTQIELNQASIRNYESAKFKL